jgi:hypothetical protein
MRRQWLVLGVMCAVVGALSLFMWLRPPKPSADIAVSTRKAASAQSLTVKQGGKTVAVLHKRDTAWRLTEPLNVPADDFQVTRVLAVLEARAASRHAPELARFELENPRAELIIDGERFAFGAINNVTQEQYLLAGGAVYAVALRHGAAIPNNAAALARRTIFAPGDKLTKFEFGEFTITQEGIKWVITPAAELSQDMTNRWIAQWREGSALRAEAADERKALHEWVITLGNGARVLVGVVQREPELVVRRADLGLQFVYAGDIGRQMLAPPPLQ